MSIRAESHIRFSTYFSTLPSYEVMRNLHDKVTLAIMDICEELELDRSYISAECAVGYGLKMFYGDDDDEVHDLGEEEEDA